MSRRAKEGKRRKTCARCSVPLNCLDVKKCAINSKPLRIMRMARGGIERVTPRGAPGRRRRPSHSGEEK